MPYLDLHKLEAEVVLSFVKMAMLFVQTVRGNMEGYTQQKVEETCSACEAQVVLGHLTNRNFLGMVRSGMITNCPVSPDAVINSNSIFGPNLAGVRGRMVRRPPESVTTNHIQIPRALLEWHQRVTWAVDAMFVNGVPFLVIVSRGLNLVTAEYTPSCTAKQLAAGIRRVMDLYSHGGFQVGTVLMNNEFKKHNSLVPILVVNTTAAKKHVLEVKQCIRLIEECGRGILNTMPFKEMPQVILIELIYHVVLWLNAFLTKTGMSAMLSSPKIDYRHKLDFPKHCKAQFGINCEAHDKPVLTNRMATRSTPAIVLGPSGNLQGTYKFFSLATGKKIKRRKMMAYPMPDLVIKKVEQFGQRHPKRF
jgi:hypothetical protein